MELAQVTSALHISVPSARTRLNEISSPPQIDRLSTMPAELRSYLAAFLDIKDIKSVHVASSAFRDVALKSLFGTIYLTPKQQSIHNLQQIAGCPHRQGLVKNLVVDLTSLWRGRHEEDGRHVQIAESTWNETERDSEPYHSYSGHAEKVARDEATGKWAYVENFQLLDFSSHAFNRAIQQLSSLEDVSVMSKHDSDNGDTFYSSGYTVQGPKPEAMIIQIFGAISARSRPLKKLAICSGTRRQLSMDIFNKMSREFRDSPPPIFDLHSAADLTYIEEQAALSKTAFHGIQVLKLDLYDHNIVQMGAGMTQREWDQQFTPGNLYDLLIDMAPTLRELSLHLHTPAERPWKFNRDVCCSCFSPPFHEPERLTPSSFAEVLPVIDFPALKHLYLTNLRQSPHEIGKFLARNHQTLTRAELNHWSCQSTLPDREAMSTISKTAADIQALDYLLISQIPNSHTELCRNINSGSWTRHYYTINAADLAHTCSSSHLSAKDILLAIAYKATISIPSYGRVWYTRVEGVALKHGIEVKKAAARRATLLQGISADQLADFAALKLRLVRQLLQCAVDADADTDSRSKWEEYLAHPHAWCDSQKDFEVHWVNGQPDLYVWNDMGWTMPLVVSRIQSWAEINRYYTPKTDVLNAAYGDDSGRAIPPTTMTGA